MTIPMNMRGVVHGKMIELSSNPGLADGQEVEVTLSPAKTPQPGAEGLQRAAGALADSWQAEDDEILNQIQQDRMRSVDRPLPLP